MEGVHEAHTTGCFEINFDDNMEILVNTSDNTTLELDYIDKLHALHESEYMQQTYQGLEPFCTSSDPPRQDPPNNTDPSNYTEDKVRSQLSNITDKIKILTKQITDITQKKTRFLDLIKKLCSEIKRLKFQLKEEERKVKILTKTLTDNISAKVRTSNWEPVKSDEPLCNVPICKVNLLIRNSCKQGVAALAQITCEVSSLPLIPLLPYIQPVQQTTIIGCPITPMPEPLRCLLKSELA